MKIKQKNLFVSILIIIALGAAACRSSSSRGVNQSNASQNMNESTDANVEIKTDLEDLEKQINLPTPPPREVKWTAKIFDNSKGMVPGPTDYHLTALLKYDDPSAAELMRKLEIQTAEKSLGNTSVKSWFPDEVKTEAKTVDGRTYLEGAKYSFNDFLRPPYRNGNLIRVGKTNYFVLNLFSF